MEARRVCTIPGCDRQLQYRGKWCRNHYDRWRRHGDPTAAVREKASPGAGADFLRAVLDGSAPVEPNGCILWPYGKTNKGYARLNGRHVAALVLERTVGPPPTADHTVGHALHEVCGNRHCLAPEHLSWQTLAEQAENRRKDGTQQVLPPTYGDVFSGIPAEVVRSAVRRVATGETRASVARDLGVAWHTVARWVDGRNRQEALR